MQITLELPEPSWNNNDKITLMHYATSLAVCAQKNPYDEASGEVMLLANQLQAKADAM
jgi:hypothetical protein